MPSRENIIEEYLLILDQIPKSLTSTLSRISFIRKKFPHISSKIAGHLALQNILQKKAERKFKNAQKMLFTQKSLEQSSSENISNIIGQYFFKDTQNVLEICSGIGGNTIGISKFCSKLDSIDIDKDLTALHNHNCLVNQLSNVNSHHKEADVPLKGEYDSIFIDPDRRPGNERSLSLNSMQPTWDFIEKCKLNTKSIIIKVSPTLNFSQIPIGYSAVYLSEDNELKVCLLLGGDAKKERSHFIISKDKTILSSLDSPSQLTLSEDKNTYLYEWDPAINQSNLIHHIKGTSHLERLHSSHHIYKGPHLLKSSLLSSWKIIHEEKFSLKKFNKFIKSQPYQRYELKAKGFDKKTQDQLLKKLPQTKGELATLFICQTNLTKMIFVCQKAD